MSINQPGMPLVTLGTVSAATQITSAVNVPANDGRIRFIGGVPVGKVVGGDNYVQNAQAAFATHPYAVEFIADSADFEFGTQGLNGPVHLWVDGVAYQARTPIAIPNDSGHHWVRLTWATRAVRRIRLLFGVPLPFLGLNIGPTDTVWKSPTLNPKKVMVLADSFGSSAADYPTTAWPYTFAELAGIDDLFSAAQGGTGYVNRGPGAGTSTDNFLNRVTSQVIPYAPDLLIIDGSVNDNPANGAGYDAASLTAQATAVYSAVGSALPNCKIVVKINASHCAPYDSNQVSIQGSLRAAAAAASNVKLVVDVIADNWLDTRGYNGSSYGRVGSTIGQGNGDRYRDADGTHWTQAGHDFAARQMRRYLTTAGLI